MKVLVKFIAIFIILKSAQCFDCEENKDSCPVFRKYFSEKRRTSPYLGVLLGALNEGNKAQNEICFKESELILKGLKQGNAWAIKAYDASGTTQSDFIYGQNFWLGSEQSCEALNTPIQIAFTPGNFVELRNSTAPFKMRYAIIYADITTDKQYGQITFVNVPLHIGLCMPASCTSEQIFELSRNYFQRRPMNFQEIYNLTLDVVEVKKLSFSNFIERSDTIILLGGLVIATVVVLLINLIPTRNLPDKNCFKRFSKCFAIKENYRNLMDVKIPKGAISSVDGIKSLACFFIMLVHVVYYAVYATGNPTKMATALYDTRFLIVFLSVIYVDVFFTSSAFLLVYNFLKNEKQRKEIEENGFFTNVKLYLKLSLHRYMRLTPALIATITFAHLAAVYIKATSPFNMPTNMDLYCPSHSWWKTLLYIHGYFAVDDMCSSWTWYLSADMQYFWVILLGLFIFVKNKNMGKIFFMALFGFSLIYSIYLNLKYDFQIYLDKFLETRNILYINPLTRMSPIFPGIWGGYWLYNNRNVAVKVPKKVIVLWVLSCFGVLIGLLSSIRLGYILPSFAPSLLNTIGKLVFCGCAIATVLLSHLGYTGFVKRFLEHKFFFHSSKLTYLLYLLYPILVALYVAEGEKPHSLTIVGVYVEGLGLIFICYLFSIFVALFYEMPYYKLSAEFITKRKIKTIIEVNPQNIVMMSSTTTPQEPNQKG